MASEEPTGVSNADVVKILATIEAFGEIMNHPRPLLDNILERARDELEGRRPPLGLPGLP